MKETLIRWCLILGCKLFPDALPPAVVVKDVLALAKDKQGFHEFYMKWQASRG